MTTWTYGISWMRIKDAFECPKRLQWGLEKRKKTNLGYNYWANKGKLVQLAFEHYFNQGVNRKEGGTDPQVMRKVMLKVLESNYYKGLELTMPYGWTEEGLRKACIEEAVNGLRVMNDMGISKSVIKSEQMWNGKFRNLRQFAMIDFEEDRGGSLGIYDGKGSKEKNADAGQIYWYVMTVLSAGRKVSRAGFIYWNHDFEEIDISPVAVKRFITERLDVVIPIFQRLKKGTEDFPMTPSKENCKYCGWRNTCPKSVYRAPDVDMTGKNEVDFGEV